MFVCACAAGGGFRSYRESDIAVVCHYIGRRPIGGTRSTFFYILQHIVHRDILLRVYKTVVS